MAIFISPEARITETSVSNFVSNPTANRAGMVGEFENGPCYELTTISSVSTYESTFGTPDSTNFKHFYTGWNFLQYSNNLQVVRAIGKLSLNAGKAFKEIDDDPGTPTDATITRLNSSDEPTVSFLTEDKIKFFYKYPGTIGNNFKVGVSNYEDFDTIKLTHGTVTDGPFEVGETVTEGVSGATGEIVALDTTYVKIKNVFGTFGTEEITGGTSGATATVTTAGTYAEVISGVTFDSLYDFSLSSDQVLVVVVNSDETEILETFACSLTVGTKDDNGNVIYINDYLERSSSYIYGYNNEAQSSTVRTTVATSLSGGTSATPSNAEIQEAWDYYLNPDESDAWVLMLGGYNENSTIQKYVIQSIADVRKEIFVTCGPDQASVVGVATESTTTSNIMQHRVNTLAVNSSYAGYYGNYKYQEDTYNSTNRWIPLDGDKAGLIVETAENISVGRDAWGYENGLIKNCIKLAFNPSKTSRDDLWKKEINSVIKDGSRFLIFGNKTLLGIGGNIFDVVDNRLLFNYIKRGLTQFMKFFLSEKNVTTTQRRLYNSIDGLLEPLQGSDDVEEYGIATDDSVNTDEVKARNEFVADVAVKPTSSIRYVDLRLYGVGATVEIEEVIS